MERDIVIQSLLEGHELRLRAKEKEYILRHEKEQDLSWWALWETGKERAFITRSPLKTGSDSLRDILAAIVEGSRSDWRKGDEVDMAIDIRIIDKRELELQK